MQGERSIRLSGIVILVRDYKDSDRTVVLFTRERGLFSFVAKGVRKLTSHNRSSTDLFIQGEYELKRSKAYYILSQGKVENSFPGIRKDLDKLSIAMTMAAFLKEVLVENMAQERVYDLFLWSLSRLSSSKDPHMLLRYFMIKALDFLGHSPDIGACQDCGSTQGPGYYSLDEGHLYCTDCGKEGFYLEEKILEAYRGLSANDFSRLKSLSFSRAEEEKLDFFLEKQVEGIIEKRFTGFDYLKKLTF